MSTTVGSFEEAMNAVAAFDESTITKFALLKKRNYGSFTVLFLSADCCLLVFERSNSIQAARHTLQYEVFTLFSS